MKTRFGVLIGFLLLLALILVSPSLDAHEGDDAHNAEHFNTPISVAPTQVVTGSATQVVTGSPQQKMVVTEDGRIVTVDGTTEVIQLRRSFWDSNFWNSTHISYNTGYYGYNNGYYPGYARPRHRHYNNHRSGGNRHNGGNRHGNNGGNRHGNNGGKSNGARKWYE